MRKIEVLIATMNQSDNSLYMKLNLQSDAIIANQSEDFGYKEYDCNGSSLKFISTNTRGVGKNRNIALLNATGEICVLGDDDLVYSENYPEIINKAFDEIPKADIIIFHIVNLKYPNKRIIKKIKKVNIFNFARYGACRIAFKLESIQKANLWFSTLYGGGARYSAGEDTLFLSEARKKGLNIYTHPWKIADAIQETSSWFLGYNEKYFFDKGVLLGNVFPKIKYLVALKTAIQYKNSSDFSYKKILSLVFKGIKEFNLKDKWGNNNE